MTQTALYRHRKRLEASDFEFRKKRHCTIYGVKTRVLISCAVTAQLICTFDFAYADGCLMHGVFMHGFLMHGFLMHGFLMHGFISSFLNLLLLLMLGSTSTPFSYGVPPFTYRSNVLEKKVKVSN